MGDSSKSGFTLKIVFSYLVLAVLAIAVGFFIFSEIKSYMFNENEDNNDAKLLKTSALLTHLYEAESLSKLAIQTKTKTNFNAYSSKIDSIKSEIDTLKHFTGSNYQQGLLDSVQLLLEQKVANSSELRNLKVRNEANNSLDKAISAFKKMEASLGKITPEALVPNIMELSPKAQQVIRDLATYLNNNVPKDADEPPDAQKIDSILNTSKALLNQAKLEDNRTQRSLERKEFAIHNNDLVLSQKLRRIIAAFEQEVIVNTYNDNLKKQAVFRRSMRFTGFAALLGFVIVGFFTFLINKDFWKIQKYRQQLEKEKKFSESLLKSREQLISTVSHDLRTPLNTIKGYSELMESTPLTNKQISFLRNVKSASQYVDSLVNDLLDYSKLEAGKIKIEKIPFVLSELITVTAENLKELHKDKGLELVLKIDKRLDTAVTGDPFRIRQIITNLISNAYKFTHEGTIEVIADLQKTTTDNYLTTITVKDSGIGIRKEKQELIFREFAQADEATERNYGGYGLGLTISKKLTELLDGKIDLKSEEGKGSTFVVTLPLAISKNTLPSTAHKTVTKKKDSSFAMLLIDDDPSMLQLLEEICATMAIKVYPYNDFSLLEKEDSLEYDAVLTDIQMPDADGFEVLQRLRTSGYLHYREQPIIAMTGRRDLENSVYFEAGFCATLQKPFGKQEFLAVLSEIAPAQFMIKNDQKLPKSIKNDRKLYNLSSISSFLDENKNAIDDVLSTFIISTGTNLHALRTAVDNENWTELKNLSHKMLPMFRQLEVSAAIPDLEFLETLEKDEVSSLEIRNRVGALENHTYQLLEALKALLTKSPSCID